MQIPDAKEREKGVDDWMLDNPFMDKVPTKGGGYTEMSRPASVVPEPIIGAYSGNDNELEQDNAYNSYEITEADFHKSLTPSALQEPRWRTPTEFPCCPEEVKQDGLKEYEENLKIDAVFSSNQYENYYVMEKAIRPKRNVLFVLCTNRNEDGYFGTYAIAAIDIKYNKYIHISMNRFGSKTDATKYYKFLIGEYQLTEDEEIMYLDT